MGGKKEKNREKFKNEIKSALETGSTCVFVREFVNPKPLDLSVDGEFCENYNCHGCSKLFAFWLDEEYEEPEIDWNNVPVDTLVRVRDREDQEWILRYFKGIDDGNAMCRYSVWASGATSKTANNGYMCWKYCELVEDEDDGSN